MEKSETIETMIKSLDEKIESQKLYLEEKLDKIST